MSTAGIIGATAAAAARQRMIDEEERMTTYSEDELQNEWEFKIVRANMGVFGKPQELQKLINEEKRAGWVLLEKLDNSRVRFKRKRSAQINDTQLVSRGIDPYRTHYGMSNGKFVALVLIITLAAVSFCVLFAFAVPMILANLAY